MSKGVSLFISYALIILLAVSAVAIIMTVGLPTIKQSQESMSFNLAINNLQQLDSMIREVASEGQGSLRAVQISVNGGKYFMNAGKLIFSFEPSKSFIPNGTNLTRGGIRIEGGQVTRFTTGNDTQAVSLYLNQTNMSVYLHGGNGTVGYANYSINMTNGTLSNNTLTGYSFSGGNANYDVLLDSDNHTSVNNLLNISGITSPAVYYNASDGTWRNVSELGNIGYGTWNLAGTSLNYTLGGADGYEYGIRDALAGGSYWLDEKGNSLETGLVGYWKFGEVSGTTTNDSSGNANSGTLGNATGGAQPTWITNSSCKFGSCLNFDGIYSFVNISNSPSLSVTDALTISAWIRTNDAVNSNTERIVQKGGGTSMYDFFIQETNKLRTILTLDTGQANIFGNTALSANTWYHVVTTFSNATGLLKIYINGIEDVSTTVSGKITTNTNPLIIGAFRGLPTDLQKFNGIIDDVRIYNRALSADEIKRLYQSTSINLKSDFLSAKVEPYIQLNLTNSTDGTIFQKVTESILVDNNPITTNYPVNASMTYFFDWKENDWKVWQKNNYVDALAGYWKFDEGQGQWATDFSGKGNNGTLGNTSASEATYDPIWISNSSCKYGSCLNFNGSQFVKAVDSASLDITSSLTVSAWVKANSLANYLRVVDKDCAESGCGDSNRAYILALDDGGTSAKMSFFISSWTAGSKVIDSSTFPTNTWVHVTGVFDDNANELRLYRDGNLIATTTGVTATPPNTAEPLKIGAYNNSGAMTNFWNGTIDDVKVWSRALSAEEIKSEYQNTKRGMPDWTDPRFKQEFKWMQAFNATNSTPQINFTYLMTSHDPFVRVFVDSKPGFAYNIGGQAFGYKRPITISGSSSALTNYQVNITIDTSSLVSAGKMRSDCGDIRFYDSDGVTSLNHWLEGGCNASNTSFWVNISSIPTAGKTIYVYYGNPSVASASNGNNTFLFFDDFPGTTLDTNKWNAVHTTDACTASSIHDSLLDFNIGSTCDWTGGSVVSKTVVGSSALNYSVTSKVKQTDLYSSAVGAYVGFTNATTYDDTYYGYPSNMLSANLHDYTSLGRYLGLYFNTYNTFTWGTTSITIRNLWFRDTLFYSPTTYIKGTFEQLESPFVRQTVENTSTRGAVPLYVVIGQGDYITAEHTYFDYVFARNVSTPEPIASVGAEFGNNITIPVSLGTEKAYNSLWEGTAGTGATCNDAYIERTPVGANNIWIFNNTGLIRQTTSDGTWSTLTDSCRGLGRSNLAFNNKVSSDSVLWSSTNWQAGIGKHNNFEVRWENTSAPATAYGKLQYFYRVNSTSNNNFFFSLGYTGATDTSSWADASKNQANAQLGFSNETIEQVANSTLTYYDMQDSKLVGWWKFNDGSTTAADSSGFGNTGTLNANVTWFTNSSCKIGFGYCLNFNDSLNYVDINDSGSLRVSSLTIGAWVKALSSNQIIATKRYSWGSNPWNSYILDVSSTNYYRFCLSTGVSGSQTCISSTTSATSDWKQITGTYDGMTMKIFVNGVQENSASFSGPIGYSSEVLRIGSDNTGSWSFNGLIDNVKIYSRVLSSDEIKADYQSTSDNYPSWSKTDDANTGNVNITHTVPSSWNYDGGAVGIWRLDEGSGSNVTDSSNGRNGYINSSTWVSGSNCKYGSCVNFTGNNYALLGTDVWDDSTFQSGGSQEAWIKINKFPAGGADYYSAFISIEGRIDFNIHDSQRLRFYVGGVNHFSTSTLQTGTWYHVVATYDAAKTVRIYINGQLDNTTSYTTWNDIDSVSRIDTIGGHYSLANFFNGTMDEVRIYNRPLSSQEVWEHYSKDVSRYYDDFNVGAKRNYGVEDSNTILQPISPNSTILHLRFNDNSTINATDSSGYGNGGGTFGGATWITNSSCKSSFEGCVAFDGSTDDILVPNSTSLAFSSTSPFTVSTWIYPRAFVDRDMIFNLENGVSGQFNFWFALLSTSKVRMSLQNGSTTQVADSLSALQTNNWYHLAATYDGSIVSIYLNGALDSSTSITSFAGTATNSPLYIGRRNPAVGSFFLNALTDEMIMINRSLSSSEINQLYLGGYNRTINGYGHRIASADSVSTIAYNLTDHDVVTQQDYDQRMLLINGTQATAFNATQVLTGSTKALNMTLQYDKITLTGTMSIQSGNYKICVQNTGVSGGKTVVNIGLC